MIGWTLKGRSIDLHRCDDGDDKERGPGALPPQSYLGHQTGQCGHLVRHLLYTWTAVRLSEELISQERCNFRAFYPMFDPIFSFFPSPFFIIFQKSLFSFYPSAVINIYPEKHDILIVNFIFFSLNWGDLWTPLFRL